LTEGADGLHGTPERAMRADDGAVVLDPVLDAPVLIGLQDVWSGDYRQPAEGDTFAVHLLRQDAGELELADAEDPASVLLPAAPRSVLCLPELVDTQAGWMVADAVMTRSTRLWVALWRCHHDGRLDLVVVHQGPGEADAAVVAELTGVPRPPLMEARFALDPVTDEVILWRGAPPASLASQGPNLLYGLPMLADGSGVGDVVTVALPPVPDPPYGAWFAGTAPHWQLRSVHVTRSGHYRARLTWAGYYDSRSTFPAGFEPWREYVRFGTPKRDRLDYGLYGVFYACDLVDAVFTLDPLCGPSAASLEGPQ
jgi:hypothetical protein